MMSLRGPVTSSGNDAAPLPTTALREAVNVLGCSEQHGASSDIRADHMGVAQPPFVDQA